MKILGLIIAFSIVASGAPALAQTASLPPPKSPVLPRAPAFASWTITFSYKAIDKTSPQPIPDADPIQSLTVRKSLATYQEVTVYRSGKWEEKWIYDGIQLIKLPGSSVIVPISAPTELAPQSNYSDYSRTDFRGLEWVSRASYKGIEVYEGKPAYYFESTSPAGKVSAFLSAEAQLPITSTGGDISCTYTFNPPHHTALIPPPDFLSVFEKRKRGLEALKYHQSPP